MNNKLDSFKEDIKLTEKVNNLPTTPGVYLWLDKYKRIIYVGKAINLRNRVRSYMGNDSKRSIKVDAMMQRAVDVEIITTKNEVEALILENNLIKEHQPKYNILLRDDKTYPYVKITLKEDFPRVYMTRKLIRDGSKYFGPFTDVSGTHTALELINKLFPLRKCKNMKVDRPCLQFHIGRCEAPCVGNITASAYKKYIDQIIDIFEGRSTKIIKVLEHKMLTASDNLEFEEAGIYRDQLLALEKIREKQRIVTDKGEFDVVGLYSSNNMTCVQIFFVRSGRLVGRENFFTPKDNETDEKIMTEFIKQYYSGNTTLPREIILPFNSSESNVLQEWLSERAGRKITIHSVQKGFKADMIKMAIDNAKTFLADRYRQWQHNIDKTGGAVKALAHALDLPRLPERMECFDISHMQGSETVASMVVFENGRPNKKEYRRFKLKTTQGKPDDFKSMAEIMRRRYDTQKKWRLPDLIIIDGGKGQLNAALTVIREMGMVDVPVISLAKRLEEVFVEGESESIILEHSTAELQLLQQIRDEAHRFAINYHRGLRTKRNLTSILDNIEGIGAKRRKALWEYFGNIDNIKNAEIEELMKVPSMTAKAAESVYTFFRLSKLEKQEILYPHKNKC